MRSPSSSVRAVIASILVVTVGLAPVYLTGALGLQIRAELGIGPAELGLAIGTFFVATALLSPVLGTIADRIGTVRSLRVAMLTAIASSLTMVLFVRSYTMLIIALVIGGIANGIAGPSTSRLVAYHVQARRSLAFGLRQAAVPLATLLAGLAVPLIGLTLGWRAAFWLVIIVAVPVMLLAGEAVVGREGRGTRATGRVENLHGLLLVGSAFLLATSAGTALMAFVVDLSVARGLTEATGGSVLAAISIAGIVARVAVGWLADRPSIDTFRVMQVQITLGLVGFALLALPTGTVGLMVGGMLGIGGGWGWTGLMAHVVAQGSPGAPARAAGIVQVGGASGGILGPPLAGALIEFVSHEAAWTVAFVLLALAVVAIRRADRSELARRFREGPEIMEVGT